MTSIPSGMIGRWLDHSPHLSGEDPGLLVDYVIQYCDDLVIYIVKLISNVHSQISRKRNCVLTQTKAEINVRDRYKLTHLFFYSLLVIWYIVPNIRQVYTCHQAKFMVSLFDFWCNGMLHFIWGGMSPPRDPFLDLETNENCSVPSQGWWARTSDCGKIKCYTRTVWFCVVTQQQNWCSWLPNPTHPLAQVLHCFSMMCWIDRIPRFQKFCQ